MTHSYDEEEKIRNNNSIPLIVRQPLTLSSIVYADFHSARVGVRRLVGDK